MVYTKCLVFPAFCGGCLKCSLLGAKWDVGSEMMTGGKRSAVNPWQEHGAIYSLPTLVAAPDWVNTLGCQQGWPGAAGSPLGQGRWVQGQGATGTSRM